MKDLRLGVIGLSDGNGHPYSWSAIFNGYDSSEMQKCPYPVIFDYLQKEVFPDAQIPGAKVTHIWTQEKSISENVARASKIKFVVNELEDLVTEVDAILLARDDSERHYEMAKPFIEAGLPIYIDKPLAITRAEATRIYDLQKYEGQIFTCSALQFAQEFQLDQEQLLKVGKIKRIEAQISKSWDKYSIHLIEPILRMVGHDRVIISTKVKNTGKDKEVRYEFNDDLLIFVSTYESCSVPLSINVIGEMGEVDLAFKDTYNAFKRALETFLAGIRIRGPVIEREFVMKAIEMIELGNCEQ